MIPALTKKSWNFGEAPALVSLVPGIALWVKEWVER